MSQSIIESHAYEIRSLARNHGAIRVWVFGSRATGTTSGSSDLDILVVLEDGRDLLDLVSLKRDQESLQGCKVDVLTEEALSPYLRDKIIQEARPL